MRSSAVIAALLLLAATSAMAQTLVAPSGIGGVSTGSLSLGAINIQEPLNSTTLGFAAPGNCPANQYETQDTTAGPVCAQPSFSQLTGTASNSQLAGPLVSVLAVPAQFTIANPAGVGTATIGYTANSLAAHNFGTGIDLTGKLTGTQPSFSDLLGTLGTGQFTATTCTNQFVSALSNSGAATCTTDILASAQHANQGTTTTVLHGNAAGNPSWASVADADLANGYSGIGACAANKFETADNRNAVPTCAQPSTANLSDVTTGTWTPTIRGSSTAGSNTYNIQVGRYIEIGSLIMANFYVSWTATSGMVGTLQVSGLPFTNANVANNYTQGQIGNHVGLTYDTGFTWVALQVAPNASVADVGENGSTKSQTLLPVANVAASGQIIGTIIYRNQ